MLLWMSCLQLNSFKDFLKQLDNFNYLISEMQSIVFIGSDTEAFNISLFHYGCISSSVRTWKFASCPTNNGFKGYHALPVNFLLKILLWWRESGLSKNWVSSELFFLHPHFRKEVVFLLYFLCRAVWASASIMLRKVTTISHMMLSFLSFHPSNFSPGSELCVSCSVCMGERAGVHVLLCMRQQSQKYPSSVQKRRSLQ